MPPDSNVETVRSNKLSSFQKNPKTASTDKQDIQKNTPRNRINCINKK